FDVAHDGSTGRSVVAGDADMTFASVLQRIDVNMHARPLSLATAGLFAPAAGLRGSATGTIIARGTRDNIQFNSDLNIANGGGTIAARGSLALGDIMRYDVRSSLVAFDPAAESPGVQSPGSPNRCNLTRFRA
ncbi:MAG TPA: hypothetical protein VM222_05520, partial [Planctomycetota bacterium]|nr:hypothetical protein [Planctomycetota bacterium]